jgi:hypothetical protein
VGHPEAITEFERLREVPGGDLDLVAALAQLVDHRPHDQDVGGIGQVDPDPHGKRE